MSIAELNQFTKSVIAAAIEVHRFCGPGLLESAYEEFLCRELTLQHMQFERQTPLIAQYKGVQINAVTEWIC
jgi:GxxExxY protein